MIFKPYILFGIILSSQVLFSECLSRDVEATGKGFQSYSFCKNTLSSPKYHLSWYSSFGTSSDEFVMLFNFDPRGSSVMCKDFEVNGKKSSSCVAFRRSLDGKIRLSEEYNNRNSAVYMYNIDEKSDIKILSKILHSDQLLYKSVKSTEEIQSNGCFAGINYDDKLVYLGYSSHNFHKLAYCLEQMERWISEDVKRVKHLLN